MDASEEDKLKVLVNQSLYDSMRSVFHLLIFNSTFKLLIYSFSLSYNMKAGPGLPANYSCFRCGSTGHHIRNCPNSGVRPVSRVCVCFTAVVLVINVDACVSDSRIKPRRPL